MLKALAVIALLAAPCLFLFLRRQSNKAERRRRAEALHKEASINWKPKKREHAVFDLVHYTYDILIIGGGASGAGCALDAAVRGLKVALIEAGDFGSQTSCKSTKLLHGGLRYLEKAICTFNLFHLCMVFEALSERYTVLRIVPYLSCTVPIMVPIYDKRKLPYYWVLLKLYDKLSMARSIGRSYLVGKEEALMNFAGMQDKNLVGAMIYHDGMFDDVRTNVMLIATASFYGANAASYVALDHFSRQTDGKIEYAVCIDKLTGRKIKIRANGYISACGALTDDMRKKGAPECAKMMSPSVGTHVIYPPNYGPRNMGLVDTNTVDGRIMFILPWKGQVLAGSTEAKRLAKGWLEPVEDEVEFINKEIESCSRGELRRGDILSAWAGVRPLIGNPNSQCSESLVRAFSITSEGPNFIALTGGKWTTYRAMAEKCINKAVSDFHLKPKEVCLTEYIKVLGSENYFRDLYYTVAKSLSIDLDYAQRLLERYGSRAFKLKEYLDKYPESISDKYRFGAAEVIYCIDNEFAYTLYDVLNNRLGVGFYDVMEAYAISARVNKLMAGHFRWSRKYAKEQLRAGRQKLDCLGYKIVSKYKQGPYNLPL